MGIIPWLLLMVSGIYGVTVTVYLYYMIRRLKNTEQYVSDRLDQIIDKEWSKIIPPKGGTGAVSRSKESYHGTRRCNSSCPYDSRD